MTRDDPFILETFLPYQLAVVAEKVSQDYARHYRDMFDLSRAEWRVVAHLSQQPSVSVREIAARAHLDKSKVSRAVARLGAEGYVTKQSSATDRRLVVLALTDKGRDMLAALTPIARAYEAEVMERLGESAESFRHAVTALMAEPDERG